MNTVVEIVDAIAWPLVVLAIAVLVLTRSGQEFIERLLGRVKKVSAFGVVELELTPETATRVRADLETTFNSYKTAIRTSYTALTSRRSPTSTSLQPLSRRSL
jgi:hypothetical protein